MKEERPDSRTSINSDVSVTSDTNLSSDRETPDISIQIKSSSSSIPSAKVPNNKKLSFGISRFLNNHDITSSPGEGNDKTRVTSDTDDDAKSFHSSSSPTGHHHHHNLTDDRINRSMNQSIISSGSHHHPLNSLAENPLMRGGGHLPPTMAQSMAMHQQLGSTLGQFQPSSAFPWFGNPSKFLYFDTFNLITGKKVQVVSLVVWLLTLQQLISIVTHLKRFVCKKV